MATNWLTNLFSGGSTSVYGTTPRTSDASVTRLTPYQQQTNTYADRLTAMARYQTGMRASGVAGVRAVDNTYNRTSPYRLPSQRAPVGPAGTVANVRLYDQYQDYVQRLRAQTAYGQRWEKGAEDFYLRNPNYVTPPVGLNGAPGGGNLYAGGGYGDGGYGDGGGGGSSGATMPDWYNNFLNQMNWRI